ncbi:MAG: hypothetical protein RLZZ245_617, partial [Verrucomicrobiota bacterium]
EEIATVTSGVVVPQALLGAGEFDVQGVAGVTEDVADDPLGTDLAAGGEELSAEFCDADGEGVREFGEGHGVNVILSAAFPPVGAVRRCQRAGTCGVVLLANRAPFFVSV